jgi:hypothetical protein
MFGLPGKTASDLYAMSPLPVTVLGGPSVKGTQVGDTDSQLLVFHTPPPSAVRNITLALVGSATAVSIRPDITGPVNAGDWATGAGPMAVQLVAFRARGAAGSCRAPENSEVLPLGSVAVAVTQSPVEVAAAKLIEKEALPAAFVVTVAEPR